MLKPASMFIAGMLLSAVSGHSTAEPLRIFTWRQDTARQLPGCVALVWARANYGELAKRPGIDYDTARPANEVADEVASELRKRDALDRAIFLWHGGIVHGTADQPELFPDARIVEAIGRAGFREFTFDWMSAFWQQLARSNLEPSLIVLDYEKAWGFWGLDNFTHGGKDLATAMEQLHAALGRSPTGFQPTDYADATTGVYNRRAVSAFNLWEIDRRAEALRQTVFDPATRIFGHKIASSNFAEQMRVWDGVDENGWPMQTRSLSGTLSSPSTYLGIGGQRYQQLRENTLAFRRALNWVDNRNEVRSSIAAGSPTAPWYSNPDYGRDKQQDIDEHRLQWAAGLLHDRSLGVNIMLFWSADPWNHGEAAFANKIIDYARAMSPANVGHLAPLSELDPVSAMASWLNLAKSLTLTTTPDFNR
jgi:hypothetical protein